MTLPTDEQCRRCGTCCRSGGPALHQADRSLVESGRLPLADLFTIRSGEPVMDNVAGTRSTAPTDIIKIKGTGRGWQCRYFDPATNGCRIYGHRPLECKLLLCANPAEAMAEYDQDRLTRRDLLEGQADLMALITDHEASCGYRELARLAKKTLNGDDAAADALVEMIAYDHHLRELIAGRAPGMADTIEFLLGRPLTASLGGFGLRAETQGPNRRTILTPR